MTVACAAAVILISGCEDVPKYKKSSGHFAEWSSYEGHNFRPFDATVAAVDPAASTITIIKGNKSSRVFSVTPETRILHNGDDVPLASVPINQAVKIGLSADGDRLLSVWYGLHSNQSERAGNARRKR